MEVDAPGGGLPSIPFARIIIMQSRACSVVGPMAWIGFHLELRLLPRTLSGTFYNQLKTVLFDQAGFGSNSTGGDLRGDWGTVLQTWRQVSAH